LVATRVHNHSRIGCLKRTEVVSRGAAIGKHEVKQHDIAARREVEETCDGWGCAGHKNAFLGVEHGGNAVNDRRMIIHDANTNARHGILSLAGSPTPASRTLPTEFR